MTLEQLRLSNTTILIDELGKAAARDDYDLVNILAFELATRFYVPFNNYATFEETLLSFGYRQKENAIEKSKKL